MKHAYVIGVTGALGAGKSTVCRLLEEHGVAWIDADKVVHELYKTGQPGWKKIKDFFGDEFLFRGGVNRKKLREFILKHPQKLLILNRLIHPLVVREVNKKIAQAIAKWRIQKKASRKPVPHRARGRDAQLFSLEAVYFAKNDLGKLIDCLILVEVDREQIIERLAHRDLTRDEIYRFLSMKPRLSRKPDFIISNRGTKQDLKREVNEAFQSILEHAPFDKRPFAL